MRSAWGNRVVVGLSGPIAAGKTTAGMFLRSEGFHYARFSQIIADILQARGIPSSREALQELGRKIHEQRGQRWLGEELVAGLPLGINLVIDGLRFPEDHAVLSEKFGPDFLHIHIEAPETVRRDRYALAGGTIEGFDTASAHPIESEVDSLRQLARAHISNDSTVEVLHSALRLLVGAARPRPEEEVPCQ